MAQTKDRSGSMAPLVRDTSVSDEHLPIAIVGNSYRLVHANPDACGMRTNEFRCRAQSLAALPRVGEEFLLNTRLSRVDCETELSVPAYFADTGIVMLSYLDAEGQGRARPLELPQSPPLRLAVGEAIARRRSRRRFTGDGIRLSDLAALLRAGAAVTAIGHVELQDGGEADLRFRSAPSGGALYPVEIFVVALQISGLPCGIYRYRSSYDDLMVVDDGSAYKAVMSSFTVTEEMVSLSRAAAVTLLVGHPWRSMRKYGGRGVRYLLLEAGAIAQNLHLAAEAAGLASVACASVYDDEIHSALRLDGLHQTLVHTIVFGHSPD